MSTYRNELPQLTAGLFLADGGLETTLVFDDGIDLPDFAAFPLLETEEGRAALVRYYDAYLSVADRDGVGIALDTPTWRASTDWAAKLGYTTDRMVELHRAAVGMLLERRAAWERPGVPVVITGVIGPRGDGYQPGELMAPAEAESYHRFQADVFADTAADLITAVTMNYEAEAVGIARAAEAAGMPVAVSFTVETDGVLPTGQPLGEAIERGGRGDRRVPRLLHGQLRPPDPLRRRPRSRGAVERTHRRHPGQLVPDEPRRARRGRGAGPGRSRRARRPLPGAAGRPPVHPAGRWLLRHDPRARRCHQLDVQPDRLGRLTAVDPAGSPRRGQRC